MKLHLSQPVRESHVRLYAQCAELLKAIRLTYFRRSAIVGECLSVAAQQISGTILTYTEVIKVPLLRTLRIRVIL